jgi:hypothetical protein
MSQTYFSTADHRNALYSQEMMNMEVKIRVAGLWKSSHMLKEPAQNLKKALITYTMYFNVISTNCKPDHLVVLLDQAVITQ